MDGSLLKLEPVGRASKTVDVSFHVRNVFVYRDGGVNALVRVWLGRFEKRERGAPVWELFNPRYDVELLQRRLLVELDVIVFITPSDDIDRTISDTARARARPP